MTALIIVADENITGLDSYLGDIAEITYLSGRDISADDVKYADALFVRSVTQVNEQLVKGSKLRFVGSCTIGTDHIDQVCLDDLGIAFANAPGCNADAVVDYVLASMFSLDTLKNWRQKKALIVGFGQVGSRLASCLLDLGITVKISDPYVSAHNASEQDWLDADMISLHVPLTYDSKYATFHLLNEALLQKLKSGVLLINSCRGKVVDNQALLPLLTSGKVQAVLDVYESEPEPEIALLEQLLLGTGHIAGYSQQGKLRGTQMVVAALRDVFSLSFVMPDLLKSTEQNYNLTACKTEQQLVKSLYDIRAESDSFLRDYKRANNNFAAHFDQYRKNYSVRNEFSFSNVTVAKELEIFARKIRLNVES